MTAALASYARQAKDDELERMAQRIRARAIRRAGELLAQIEPAKPGPKEELQAGTRPQFGKGEAARQAGMSPHQQKLALRVAAVPAPDFEAMVEAPQPATVTQIAAAEPESRDRVGLRSNRSEGIEPAH